MKDKVFLDTNILIYVYSVTEPNKQEIAAGLSGVEGSYISTQVVQELSNILFKKFSLKWSQILNALDEITNNFQIVNNNISVIKSACQIAKKYQFSFYDSLIISSALNVNCSILYTEDLQHNQIIEDRLRIINPFMKLPT